MTKFVIVLVALTSILCGTVFSQEVYGPLEEPRLDDRNFNDISESKAIPDWVKNQFDWYLKGEIDESTLLTSMNWMFDNNIMHLSQKAALEVKQLREENQRYEELLGHELSHTIQQDSGVQTGSNQSSPGERLMQPEFGTSQSKVVVRGWDPEKKEEIVGTSKTVARFVVELYAESMSLSDVIWLPMTEGEVLVAHEGDLDKPIIIGRIYNESSQVDSLGDLESSSTSKISTIDQINTANESVDAIIIKGGSISDWEENISFMMDSAQKISSPHLEETVILYSNAIDKKTQRIEAELNMISQWQKIISETEENSSYDDSGRLTSGETAQKIIQYRESDLNFITEKLTRINQQIQALETGLSFLEEKIPATSEDYQISNIDLQNSLQKQKQALQTLSNVSKAAHDTAMATIRNMK